MDALTAANISLITPATTPAEVICARHYDLTRRALLEAYHYNFAKEYIVLQPSSVAPTNGWTAKYKLPPDFCGLQAIIDEDTPLTKSVYTELGRYIYINYDGALPIYYTKDVTDPTEMTASFIYYLAYELAMNTAKALGAKDERLVKLETLRKQKENAAKCNSSKNRPGKIIFSSRLMGAAQTYTGPATSMGVTGLTRRVM